MNSQIDILIKQLCPNGVEWVKLGEVIHVLRGRRLTKKELTQSEKYPVFHGGIEPIGFYHENNRPGDTVMVINVGASAGTVGYSSIPFWSSDGCFCISQNDNILGKYLFTALKEEEKNICSQVRKAGIPTLDQSVIERLSIPLPPLPIQQEIVNILDKFTSLINKIDEEIKLRQKQYDYYREKLLEASDKTRTVNLLDMLCQPITDGPHETPKFFENGIPFISVDAIEENKINFERRRGFISEEYDIQCRKKYSPQKDDVFIVKSGSTVGKVAIVDTDIRFNIWSPLAAMRVNSDNNPRYLYYLLLSKEAQQQVKDKCSKGSQPNLSMRILEKFKFQVPPLPVQQSIVSTLDKFETLIANLKQERDLRQKQYEYYREKLLTF